MKKIMTAICSTVIAFTAIAQDVAKQDGDKPGVKAEEGASRPSAEARQQRLQRMRREGMRNRQRPLTFGINEKTTSEQIEAFKKEVCAKIDEAAKAYAAQEGEKKSPKNIVLFVNDRPNRARYEGMREGGMRRGPRDGVRRGPRDGVRRGPRDGVRRGPREGGDRGLREGGDRPAESAEAKK